MGRPPSERGRPGSGSGLVLAAWFAHLALTGVVGWFLVRHLRRSRLPWLPPRHWMILMAVALVLVSLAFPVGMLPAASAGRLPGHMPLDPFVLFLLPPLLSGWRWVAVVAGGLVTALVVGLPRLLRAADPAPVVIDADACTGCELCVIDCPYRALTMVAAGGTEARGRSRSREPSTAARAIGRGGSGGLRGLRDLHRLLRLRRHHAARRRAPESSGAKSACGGSHR